MSLQESGQTFTVGRLQILMQKHSFSLDAQTGMAPPEFLARNPIDLMTKAHNDVLEPPNPAGVLRHPQGFPKPDKKLLIKSPSESEEFDLLASLVHGHLRLIDSLDSVDEVLFIDLLDFRLRPFSPPEVIIDNVVDLLMRLPAVPVELHNPESDPGYEEMPDAFFLDPSRKSWETLRVNNYVSSTILALALTLRNGDERAWSIPVESFCIAFTRLLDHMISNFSRSKRLTSPEFVLRCFYWNIWQRGLMLRQHLTMATILNIGLRAADAAEQARLQYRQVQNRFRQAVTFSNNGRNNISATKYMCRWAFELFRNNINASTMDFRHMFQVFREISADQYPRCITQGDGTFAQCDGSSPQSCSRFIGMQIEDQSAHAATCDRQCRRLHWSESSYRECEGGRAVSVGLGNEDELHYCAASDRTIAVSHVWSHGQGGRPEAGETGLNSCLHKRYSNIARLYDCDSYWIDTACIPSDRELRKEAIGHINSTFETSFITLVCDRDLALCSVSEGSIRELERVLATFLLCDWNIRAWTLLEGMRGRMNLHLLCKDDAVLPFHDTIRRLHKEGRIDLSILALVAQHLFHPATVRTKPWKNRELESYREYENSPHPLESASLLSHRHASRGGDEIVIWSLLCTKTVSDRAEDLWVDRILKYDSWLNTGYLISSLPRLKDVKGLS